MASLIGLGNSGTLTADEVLIFDSAVDVISAGVQAGAAVFTVDNGTGVAYIRNPVINGTGNWYKMMAGASKEFLVARAGGVGQLYAKSDASGTVISGAPTGAM